MTTTWVSHPGFAEIIRVVIVNATSITNGSLGIKGIPGEATLLTCYIWTVITLVVLSRLIFSNFGNVLRCIRDNEIAAGVMGINVFRYKVLSFCVGAFFAGVGGALLGSHLSTIDPKMFNFLLTFNVLMFVVAGGLGSLTGSLLGATIVTILLEWLRAIEEPMDFGVFEIPGIPACVWWSSRSSCWPSFCSGVRASWALVRSPGKPSFRWGGARHECKQSPAHPDG